ESLQKYHHFFGESFKVECPTGSGRKLTLGQVAIELSHRLSKLFLRDQNGFRPAYTGKRSRQDDPNWRDLILFHEFFDGDTGRGLGASHQTGWTALVACLLENCARRRGLAQKRRKTPA